MELSIVIPHYNASSYRERNLLRTVEHYAKSLPDTPIVIIEQLNDRVIGVDIQSILDVYSNVKWYALNTDSDDFMKAALINKAVFDYTTSDYIAMIDNDCVLTDVTVEKLIPNKECSIFIPYTSINFLGESHTRQWIRKGFFRQNKPRQDMHISRYTGGINVFSRKTFNGVGGFDEVFVNWGAEDDAFHIKCKRIVGPIERINVDTELLHLWHPSCKTQEYTQSAPYMRNKKRVACIKRMSDDDLNRYTSNGSDTIKSVDDLNLLMVKYEDKGKLHIMVKVRVGNGNVTMDSTIYDVDADDGEVSLRDILDCVLLEEGPNAVVSVATQIRNTIPEIDTFSESILSEFEDNYSDM